MFSTPTIIFPTCLSYDGKYLKSEIDPNEYILLGFDNSPHRTSTFERVYGFIGSERFQCQMDSCRNENTAWMNSYRCFVRCAMEFMKLVFRSTHSGPQQYYSCVGRIGRLTKKTLCLLFSDFEARLFVCAKDKETDVWLGTQTKITFARLTVLIVLHFTAASHNTSYYSSELKAIHSIVAFNLYLMWFRARSENSDWSA